MVLPYYYPQFLLRLVFFFSSRRRHTRFSRDWSSDVCSSDLRVATPTPPPAGWHCATLPPSATLGCATQDRLRDAPAFASARQGAARASRAPRGQDQPSSAG